MYIPTDLSITGPQLRNLILKGTCQIGKDGLKDCNSRVLLHPMMAQRVEKARKSGKGVRLMCNLPEIQQTGVKGLKGSGMSGTGWWSSAVDWVRTNAPKAFNYIKDTVVPWVKDNIIDSQLYQEKLKPIVHEKLHGKLEGLPYANVTIPAAEWIEGQTGLGVKKRPVAKPKPKPKSMQKNGGSFRTN